MPARTKLNITLFLTAYFFEVTEQLKELRTKLERTLRAQ